MHICMYIHIHPITPKKYINLFHTIFPVFQFHINGNMPFCYLWVSSTLKFEIYLLVYFSLLYSNSISYFTICHFYILILMTVQVVSNFLTFLQATLPQTLKRKARALSLLYIDVPLMHNLGLAHMTN